MKWFNTIQEVHKDVMDFMRDNIYNTEYTIKIEKYKTNDRMKFTVEYKIK